jgi:hypothetical protein
VEYARRVEALRAFTAGVNRYADDYVRKRPRDVRIALCLTSWLERWAQYGAMLPASITTQGNAERKWNLVAFALSYTMTADAPEIDTTRRRVIENWLRELALAWIAGPDYSKERPNNHLNWGGLALMATGIAIRDQGLFDEGLISISSSFSRVVVFVTEAIYALQPGTTGTLGRVRRLIAEAARDDGNPLDAHSRCRV